MDADQFVRKWTGVTLKERSSAQEHFLDLCHLLEEPTPAEADPTGERFCFEKGADKAGGGDGWADVWRRGCFAWEYKSPGKDLKQAFKQLQLYTPALEYPPLLIVSDVQTIELHTAFTGLVPVVHRLQLEDLRGQAKRRLLKWAFSDPGKLKPAQTTANLTEEAAWRFAELAQALRSRGQSADAVAHFSQQLLFCLFAEDIDLLPNQLFSRLLKAGKQSPAQLKGMLGSLFGAMAKGGLMGVDVIDWFNGGLFSSDATLPLTSEDVDLLIEVARLDWSAINPIIFGVLFERGLDPDKRSQLGAHFTDPVSIMRLVDPVVLQPLREAWSAVKLDIQAQLNKAASAKSQAARTKATHAGIALFQGFLERLRRYRVLDPACGSGNFLLLALLGLKDLEHQIILEAEAMGLPRAFPMIGPENVLGIELSPFAAELARVVVWIGEIQWMLSHGFSLNRNPILKPLDTIENRDAVLNADGSEPEWPEADAIVGNPPFVGGSKKRRTLGDAYFDALAKRYAGRVPAGADLVTYWFEKARAQLASAKTQRAGLVATQSIRRGSNQKVLTRITETGVIFEAWSDEPWINEGADVRVSLIAFAPSSASQGIRLNGQPVATIYADLTGNAEGGLDLGQAQPLPSNAVAFEGTKKYGDFDIPGDVAREWLLAPNPDGRSNREVLKPWRNGQDLARRPADHWIIDFGVDRVEADAALFEQPYQHVLTYVKPSRSQVNNEHTRAYWWIHERPRAALRQSLTGLRRFIATPRVAKHRFFVWLPASVLPDTRLCVICRDDDITFGILSSRLHVIWALSKGSRHGDGDQGGRPTYNAGTCFETFPFPEGCTPADTRPAGQDEADPLVSMPRATWDPAQPALVSDQPGDNLPPLPDPDAPVVRHWIDIAKAASQLNRLRERWLNPPEWVDIVPEVVPGYPDRIIPKPEHEKELKKRTLTNLYNQRPAWLDNAHKALDAAVAAAYGWDDYRPEMPDEEILSRLLALNLQRTRRPTSRAGRP
ncbi:MAG: hypothetical protein K9L32_10985 [Chromatiaceae bacterium]|nr:hypothetical protein [Chromatiaceae bacterium]